MEDDGHHQHDRGSSEHEPDNILLRHASPDVLSALKGVCFIAQHIKDADKDNEVSLSLIPIFKYFWNIENVSRNIENISRHIKNISRNTKNISRNTGIM